MKKKFLLVLMLFLVLMPMSVFAKDEKIVKENYKFLNFEQVLEQEEIKLEFSDYKETEEQITIYLFRGKGCAYCKKFLNYLNSITEEYGKYFKLESYEVWYDHDNSKLLEEVSDFLEQSAQGVPYIVIGDKVFAGYTEQYNNSIISAITEQYNSEEKYDVFDEMAKAYDEEHKTDYSQTILIIVCNFIFILIATSLIIVYIDNKNMKLNNKLEELEKNLKKEIQKEEIKKNAKTTKKESKI